MAADEELFARDPTVVTYPDIEGPQLTEEMVVRAEEELGRVLPASYIDAMRRCNGGYLRRTCIATARPTSWASDHVSMRSIFGIPGIGDSGRFGVGAGILGTPYLISEWGLPAEVVLLDGDGHTWIALDYRTLDGRGEPSVVWLDLELDDELTIAPSFSGLLASLRPDTDFPDE